MRRLALLLLASSFISAAAPAWWTEFCRKPAVESRFRQESESLVFGKLSREGRLTLAGGGRLWVVYEGGLMVACDGQHLVQYDPDTRTAQRMELKQAVRDFPLLGLLLDPARIAKLYRIESLGGEAVKLTPREAGLPELKATGRGGLLRSLEWTDPTGARQQLHLLDPKRPAAFDPSLFRPRLPEGTRWATAEPSGPRHP